MGFHTPREGGGGREKKGESEVLLDIPRVLTDSHLYFSLWLYVALTQSPQDKSLTFGKGSTSHYHYYRTSDKEIFPNASKI